MIGVLILILILTSFCETPSKNVIFIVKLVNGSIESTREYCRTVEASLNVVNLEHRFRVVYFTRLAFVRGSQDFRVRRGRVVVGSEMK